jgi:hypothetical protein
MKKTIMKRAQLLIALLFAVALSHTAYAEQTDGTQTKEIQETQPEPECDNRLSPGVPLP